MTKLNLDKKTVRLQRLIRKKTGESYAHKKYIFDKSSDPNKDFITEVPVKLAQKLMKKGIYLPVEGIKENLKTEKIIPKSYRGKNKDKIKRGDYETSDSI